MSMEKIYRIYTLAHPITLEIVYVGQTRTTLIARLIRHYSSCLSRTSNIYKWIKELRDNNLVPIIELLEEVDSSQKDIAEIFWISQLRNWNFNLLNQNIGGQGNHGYKHPEERRKLISENNIGKKGQVGIHYHSEESLEKMRQAKLGKSLSEEARQKLSSHNKNRIGGSKTKVIDTETGIIYSSISEAATKLNIKKATLRERVKNNIGSIQRLEEPKYYNPIEKIKIREHKNQVIDINTNIIYESGKEAARQLGLNYNSLKKKIRNNSCNIRLVENKLNLENN
jgi:group I intron endonuclease